jgi:hypothetical protein
MKIKQQINTLNKGTINDILLTNIGNKNYMIANFYLPILDCQKVFSDFLYHFLTLKKPLFFFFYPQTTCMLMGFSFLSSPLLKYLVSFLM